MTKKHFIALADEIKEHNRFHPEHKFDPFHLEVLADFCYSENCNFKKDRWLDYIDGNCGPNGGKVK